MKIKFGELYKNETEVQKERYRKLKEGFENQFGDAENIEYFSAPGRTEIGGNHTDHNHGHVLAAAVNLDIIAAARKTADGSVVLKSAEYSKLDVMNISDLEKKDSETGRSASLIRGILARCKSLGYKIGGFEAFTMNNVLKGSGLSSSAAFEVAVVAIISHLYNEGGINPVEAAIISQYAENEYFGKPSGLMDQMASSVGGVTSIDFNNPQKPIIKSIAFDLNKHGFSLCITDTGGSHAELTDEYTAITEEMRAVSEFFGKSYLRDVDKADFYTAIPELRAAAGDRAILRAMHFFDDDENAVKEAAALENGNFDEFLHLVNKSGESSLSKLQNVFSVRSVKEQGISLGIALSREILGGAGACRVHGGGFAGTMQAYVPNSLLPEYIRKMEAVFGEKACYVLSFRGAGGVKVEL